MEGQHKKKKSGSAKKAASHGIKDRKSVSEQKKKVQRAERIPERKKSNWDDGEFLDDWDGVSGKTAAHSNKRRVAFRLRKTIGLKSFSLPRASFSPPSCAYYNPSIL